MEMLIEYHAGQAKFLTSEARTHLEYTKDPVMQAAGLSTESSRKSPLLDFPRASTAEKVVELLNRLGAPQRLVDANFFPKHFAIAVSFWK